jgi:hypothetical protein
MTHIVFSEIRLSDDIGGLDHPARLAKSFLGNVDTPAVGNPVSEVFISGWLICAEDEVDEMILASDGRQLHAFKAGGPRPDAAEAVNRARPQLRAQADCGFGCLLQGVSGPANFEWILSARLTSGRTVEVARLRGGIAGDESRALPPKLQRTGARTEHNGLLIAGFHRSGTSALALALQSAGIPLGHELIPPLLSNPNGHFEDCWAVDIDDSILRGNGTDWQYTGAAKLTVKPSQIEALAAYCERRLAEAHFWAVKDPRAGLLLDSWDHASSGKLMVIAPLRNAGSSAESLRNRHANELAEGPAWSQTKAALRFWSEPELPFRMWIRHHSALLNYAESRPDSISFMAQSELDDARGDALLQKLLPKFDANAAAAKPAQVLQRARSEVSLAGLTPELAAEANTIARALCAHTGATHQAISPGHAVGQSDGALEALIDSIPFVGQTQQRYDTPSSAASTLSRAMHFAEEQEWPAVAQLLTGVWLAPAERTECMLLLARAERAVGNWNSAVSIYSALLSSTPTSAEALVGAAEVLQLRGEAGACIDAIRSFMACGEGSPWPWLRCSRLVMRLANAALEQNFDATLRRAATLTHHDWAALIALWEMRRGHLSAATETVSRVKDQTKGLLLQEVRVELALRKGDVASAKRDRAEAFLCRHDKAGYRDYLQRIIQQVGSNEMRADLTQRLVTALAPLSA